MLYLLILLVLTFVENFIQGIKDYCLQENLKQIGMNLINYMECKEK
jgi:hypothetical protein